MEKNNSDFKIVLLSEDIRNIVKTARDGHLEMMRFCRDHTDPYLLDDKRPVLNINQDPFITLFDYGPNHLFLEAKHIYRFGHYCKLSICQIIALIVKGEWEKHFSESVAYSHNPSVKLNTMLTNRDLVDEHISDFKLNMDSIYQIICKLPYADASSMERSHINLIISDMIKERHFLSDNLLMNQFYPENEYTEIQLLKRSTTAEVQSFKKLKYLWEKRRLELEEKLYNLEKKRQQNTNMTDVYFRNFGRLELKKMDAIFQVEKYKKVLELKTENSELTYKLALQGALKYLSEIEKRTRKLKNSYSRSLNCLSGILMGERLEISEAELEHYETACRTLLKKLFFLLHTDTCPILNLSEAQKSGISKLWLELMSTKEEIHSYAPGMLMWLLPDYNRLHSILRRACKLLDIAEEDLDVADPLALMIRKGMPIERIIEFLKNDIENLQVHLTNLEIIQDDYTDENTTQIHRNALENVEAHRNKLKNEIVVLKKQIQTLKANIKALFKKTMIENHVY